MSYQQTIKLFEGFNQFINWVPKPRKDGKIDKVPVGIEGKTIDPLNSKNWLSEIDARKVAEHTGHGLGFVFTEKDPFFFVDIDNAIEEGDWSSKAKTIIKAFPGCAVEVSHSGKGLHIFGVGKVGPHSCRNRLENLEFYTEKRFVALTGTGLIGNSATNGTSGVKWLVKNYFGFNGVSPVSTEWTDKSCTEWNGETDDTVLLKRARKDRRASVIFGDKASFSQLFDGDADKLEEFFPATQGYDVSSADAALCQHLAYWTGKDCKRMERLFFLSELGKRDKWQNREDYRERTILNAVALCKSVYKKPDPIGKVDKIKIRVGSQILDLSTQLKYFKGCVYVINRHRIFVPTLGLLKSDVFKATYGGYDFAIRQEGRPVKNAFEVFTESQLYDFPIANGTCFRPEKPSGKIIMEEGFSYVNTYTPVAVDRLVGDAGPFIRLLKKLLPVDKDRKILLSYMAACVQFPGDKFQWAPLIQGMEGNGKTFIATTVAKAVGEKYTHRPNAADLAGNGLKFTGWMDEKLFIIIEELFKSGKTNVQEALKDKITNPRIEIQKKGMDQFQGDNRANFMFCSQHRDSILKTGGDRRYCVFYTAQQEPGDLESSGMTKGYFPKLYEWARNGGYAIITDYLHTYKIEQEFNPALENGGRADRAPVTSSTAEALILSLGGVEQEIMEAVEEDRLGFRGGWISSVALDLLLKEKNYKVPLNKRKDLLKLLGYIKKCRMNSGSPLDSKRKPTLYIAREYADLRKLKAGIETETAYLKAQGYEIS